MEGDISIAAIVGHWIAIFLTISIMSYLYDDNPFYKVAEHLFVGISIGYVLVIQWFEVLKPNLVDRLLDPALGVARAVYVVPLILVVFLFLRLTRRFSWLGRISIAFIIGTYAGLEVPAVANADLVQQLKATIQKVAELSAADDPSIWSILGVVVLVGGLVAGIVYFFFSIEHKGPIGVVAKGGVWVLMIGFGAAFGYTVQGRIALAIGRAMYCLGINESAAEAEAYQSKLVSALFTVVIFGTIVALDVRRRRREKAALPDLPVDADDDAQK